MSRRIDNDVTIDHASADEIARLLNEYASHQGIVARRSRSAAVRAACLQGGERAVQLSAMIVNRLYTWEA